MKNRPRTIQIYLPSGDPRGIRIAAMTTSIVQVLEIPRALLSEFLGMNESKQVGLYFLVGDDVDDMDQPRVYIGQTGGLGKRLGEHHTDAKMDFWNRALVVISLTQSFTQTHSLYLEWSSIQCANQAGRYSIKNGNAGSKPHTPAPLEADCQEIFDTLRTLVATLGQPVFEPLSKAQEPNGGEQAELFYCKSAAYDATAQYTVEGMVVLKGSMARIKVAPSSEKGTLGKVRSALLADGALKQEGSHYIFQRDVLFKSPSGASDAVAGASTNGWDLWKAKGGKTLDELKRKTPENQKSE